MSAPHKKPSRNETLLRLEHVADTAQGVEKALDEAFAAFETLAGDDNVSGPKHKEALLAAHARLQALLDFRR